MDHDSTHHGPGSVAVAAVAPVVEPQGALALTRRPGPGDGCSISTVRTPVHSEAVGQVRALMADDLVTHGVGEELVEDAQIVLTELLTNAFRHAWPLSDETIRVRWKVRPDSLEVEVTDGGSTTTPHPVPHGVWRDSGRGLRVVRALAHEWGVGEDRTGHVVWATLGGPSRRRVT